MTESRNNSGDFFALRKKTAKTKGEVALEDLPPIEDLKITVGPRVELKPLGIVSSVVDTLGL